MMSQQSAAQSGTDCKSVWLRCIINGIFPEHCFHPLPLAMFRFLTNVIHVMSICDQKPSAAEQTTLGRGVVWYSGLSGLVKLKKSNKKIVLARHHPSIPLSIFLNMYMTKKHRKHLEEIGFGLDPPTHLRLFLDLFFIFLELTRPLIKGTLLRWAHVHVNNSVFLSERRNGSLKLIFQQSDHTFSELGRTLTPSFAKWWSSLSCLYLKQLKSFWSWKGNQQSLQIWKESNYYCLSLYWSAVRTGFMITRSLLIAQYG